VLCAGFASLPEVLPMAKPRVFAREFKAAVRRILRLGGCWTSAALYFSIHSCSLSSKVQRLLELFSVRGERLVQGLYAPAPPNAIPSAELLSEIVLSFGTEEVERTAQSYWRSID
jgi:hypothetical protein